MLRSASGRRPPRRERQHAAADVEHPRRTAVSSLERVAIARCPPGEVVDLVRRQCPLLTQTTLPRRPSTVAGRREGVNRYAGGLLHLGKRKTATRPIASGSASQKKPVTASWSQFLARHRRGVGQRPGCG